MGLSFIQMMSLRRCQPVSRRENASIHGMPIMSLNAVIGQGFRDFEAIAGVNDVKLYGGVHPCLLY